MPLPSSGTPVEIPEDLPAGAAPALLVQGLTAWHLLRTAARLVPGESVLINAAAGCVGAYGDATRQGVRREPGDRHGLHPGQARDGARPTRVLAPFGRLISHGNSGGVDSAPVDPGLLGERNISVGGYWLGAHLRLPGSTAAEPLTELTAVR